MKIKRYYKDYASLRESLINKTHKITDQSIGQYFFERKEKYNTRYSIDVIVRDYDGTWIIDSDIYDITGEAWYLDRNKVCKVIDLPVTDDGFWQLIANKFEECFPHNSKTYNI